MISAISNLWKEFQGTTGSNPLDNNSTIALIVQRLETADALGHLSNERRVSEKETSWRCEYEEPFSRPPYSFELGKETEHERIVQSTTASCLKPSRTLNCDSQEELQEKIRLVAEFAYNKWPQRCHYEWAWDGHRLWIVQRDLEEDYVGTPPGEAWEAQSTIANADRYANNLSNFVSGLDSDESWRKLKVLRVLQACDLPYAEVFVLERESTLSELAAGILSDSLRRDLLELLANPLVIRTDVKRESGVPPTLLPRTDTIRDVEDVAKFLHSTSRRLSEEGLDEDEFCFIAHWFIVSKACALSLAKPGESYVRIDSSWGLPDGLSYNPHDSFRVYFKYTDRVRVESEIRCKTKYLDVNSDGEWFQKEAGRPWDWKPSLSKDEAAQVAHYSRKIANHLQSTVVTMFFVGVDSDTGYPSCIPWHFTTDTSPEPQNESLESRILVKSYYKIENKQDYQKTARKIESEKRPKRKFIKLDLEKDLIRDKEFIRKVGLFADEKDMPIKLEGSTLSHVYYLLKRMGIRVSSI